MLARSNVEAEFHAIARRICEGLWIKRMLEELKIGVHQPMQFLSDNKVALKISRNLVHHDRTKHVEFDQYFIKEKIESGVLDISYVSTKEQVANVSTKGLSRSNFKYMVGKLGMLNIFCPA